MGTQLDLEAGLRAAEKAIERVGAAAHDGWYREAVSAVIRLSESQVTFTTDDVWISIPDEARTHERRALGSVMRRLAEQGVIEATGDWRPTARPEAHGRPVRVWRARLP